MCWLLVGCYTDHNVSNVQFLKLVFVACYVHSCVVSVWCHMLMLVVNDEFSEAVIIIKLFLYSKVTQSYLHHLLFKMKIFIISLFMSWL